MPKISGRYVSKNSSLPDIDNKKMKKAEPNPIDEDIFVNAK
jgi:alpha-D-ribose 1-methylphosphonate 5-phosphate C-P lyase